YADFASSVPQTLFSPPVQDSAGHARRGAGVRGTDGAVPGGSPWRRAPASRAPGLRRRLATAALVAVLLLLTACSDDDGRLHVYATTGYLADVVANVAPAARVTTMVGPGGDPHTYQPSTRDIAALHGADVVLWTGLHLEAQLSDQLSGMGDRQHAVGEA